MLFWDDITIICWWKLSKQTCYWSKIVFFSVDKVNNIFVQKDMNKFKKSKIVLKSLFFLHTGMPKSNPQEDWKEFLSRAHCKSTFKPRTCRQTTKEYAITLLTTPEKSQPQKCILEPCLPRKQSARLKDWNRQKLAIKLSIADVIVITLFL